MKLIESLRGIENSFTNVKKVSKKEITKTELSESLFKAASQIDQRNYKTSFDLTKGYQRALEEAIEKVNPDKRWFEVTDCDIRTTLLENHNNIEETIRRILNESDSAEEVEDEAEEIENRDDEDAFDIEEGCHKSLKEKVVHQGSKWVNKGPEGTHGEFTTKKAADAQRKAIAASYDDDDTSYIINVSKSDSPKYVKKFEDDEVVTSTKKDDAKKFGTKSSAEKFIKDKDITGKVVTENIDDLGVDLGEFQEWIDYDMKHYGEISELTRKEIESAGLEIIKDDHGDYELIAKPYDGEYDESLKESQDSTLKDKVYELVEDGSFDPVGLVNILLDYAPDDVLQNILSDYDEYINLNEDTVKQGSSWVNKGDTGETHGKFKTKKEADAQRKAMFAQGYKAEDCTSKECDEVDSSKETLTEEDADEEAYKKLKDGQSFKDALK